jgi:nucleoside-diphosphate-sugar epimerase
MTDGKRAVVFGGAGFVGQHLIASLLRRGYGEVTSVDIAPPRTPVPGARYVTHDVRQPIPGSVCTVPVDEVYNLAAVHRTPGHPDREYFDTNVAGAENVCQYCRITGVSRLVFTSSISVYGPAEEPKDEESVPAPVSAYGRSKLEAEAIHQAWAQEDSARCLVIVRPAVVFGPFENGNFTRLAQALKRRIFFYAGRRDTIKGCGSVDDLVGSMSFALGLKKPEFLYNYCYPELYTIQDICETFHSVAGLSRPLGTAPLWFLMAVGRLFELAAALGIKTGIHRDRVMKVVQSTHIVPKALVEAGYVYETDLTVGLRRWQAAAPTGEFL